MDPNHLSRRDGLGLCLVRFHFWRRAAGSWNHLQPPRLLSLPRLTQRSRPHSMPNRQSLAYRHSHRRLPWKISPVHRLHRSALLALPGFSLLYWVCWGALVCLRPICGESKGRSWLNCERLRSCVWIAAVIVVTLLGLFNPGNTPVLAQQPTGSVANGDRHAGRARYKSRSEYPGWLHPCLCRSEFI